ncbi:hypothetical protein XENTR_v10020562 [Xenopus tropicalis]|nr:hypothetical protein XENTR_v10020562 [Xenopus tropicalis]
MLGGAAIPARALSLTVKHKMLLVIYTWGRWESESRLLSEMDLEYS